MRHMTRLRREDGHTLPELLTALGMATVILLATFALLDHVMKRTAETQARVEASQRGRQAMDTMSRAVRSSVCLSGTVPAVSQADASTMTFYTDLGDGAAPPQKQVLVFDPARRTIVQRIYPGTGAPPATVYPASPAQEKLLAENVHRDGSTPIFRYFGYTALAPPTATLALPGPVAAADLGRIARVSMAFVTNAGSGAVVKKAAVSFSNDVYFRAADPNDPAPYPSCA